MKTYDVTIKAIIWKTFRVTAEDTEEAYADANELFNPYSGEAEKRYEQNVVDIREVTA